MLLLLKALGITIVLIGLLHASLGVRADRLLDGTVPDDAVAHASMDSQNRFYGSTFSVFGVLLWLCSTDMDRYEDVFRAILIVFFIGGLARIVSVAARGWPSRLIIGLTAIELLVPPLLLWWQVNL